MKSWAYTVCMVVLTALELVMTAFFGVFIVLGGLSLYAFLYYEEWMYSLRELEDDT